jgi:hypothetical protein
MTYFLIEDKPAYLIGHPNAEPMVNDPKIEIYKYSKEKVDKSNKWANANGFSYGNHYEGIDDPKKILFGPASLHCTKTNSVHKNVKYCTISNLMQHHNTKYFVFQLY